MGALPSVWSITEAGTPPQALGEGAVRDVEALVLGILSRSPGVRDLPSVEREELRDHLFERVIVLAPLYDPSRDDPGRRAPLLFRLWLYAELRNDAIDHLRQWRGRRGQKAVVDTRLAVQAARDGGLDDESPRVDRLGGSVTSCASDSPQDRASDLERLYAQGDRATLREERRMGLGPRRRAARGAARASVRAGRPDVAGTLGTPHWLDCAACGWRNYRSCVPNGVAAWHFPEHCLACSEPLVLAVAEEDVRVA